MLPARFIKVDKLPEPIFPTSAVNPIMYIMSQEYDERKWAIAAAACKRVMDMNYTLNTVEANFDTPELPLGITHDPNYYKLWPEGAAGIDHYRSYADMFNGEALAFKNKEYVFAKNSRP